MPRGDGTGPTGQGSQKGLRGGNRSGAASFGGRHQFGRGQGRKSPNRKASLTVAPSNATELGAAAASSADSTKEGEITVLERQATELSQLLREAQSRLAELKAGAADSTSVDSTDK